MHVRRATPSRSASCSRPAIDLRRRPASTTSARCRRRPRSPARCSPGVVLVLFGVTMFYFRMPFFDGSIVLSADLDAADHRAVAARDDARRSTSSTASTGSPPASSPSRAGAFFLYSQQLDRRSALLDAGQRRPADRDHRGRRLRRLPSAQLQPGPDLHGRRRRAAARAADGGVHDRRRRPRRPISEFIGQTYFFFAPLFIPLLILGVPILDTLFAIVRRADRPPGARDRRQGPPPPPPDAPRPRPPPQCVILWTWTALLSGFVLYPTLTGRTRPTCRSRWPPWPSCSTRPAPERAADAARSCRATPRRWHEPTSRAIDHEVVTVAGERRRRSSTSVGCCLGRSVPTRLCMRSQARRATFRNASGETDTRAWTMDR